MKSLVPPRAPRSEAPKSGPGRKGRYCLLALTISPPIPCGERREREGKRNMSEQPPLSPSSSVIKLADVSAWQMKPARRTQKRTTPKTSTTTPVSLLYQSAVILFSPLVLSILFIPDPLARVSLPHICFFFFASPCNAHVSLVVVAAAASLDSIKTFMTLYPCYRFVVPCSKSAGGNTRTSSCFFLPAISPYFPLTSAIHASYLLFI